MSDVIMPSRPRLRAGLAVLRRGNDEIQIGLDPRRATVVSDLPASVIDVASALSGGSTAAELLAHVGPTDTAQLHALLTRLTDLGLVEDASAPATAVPRRLAADETTAKVRRAVSDPYTRADAAVTIHGDGRLAVAIGCQLAAAGIGGVHVDARGTVGAEDVGAGLSTDDIGRPRHTAAHDAIRQVDGTVRTHEQRPDLVVLTDALVPDPAIVADLMRRSLPHLPVRIRDGVGLVGPLIVPGKTACLTCADRHRADRDPHWPMLAAQLAGRSQFADLPTVHATAGLAVTQVLMVLRGLTDPGPRLPTVWNRALELDAVDGTIVHRPWPPHAQCDCRVLAKEAVRM
jgi:bacteriocin biosynthesis cyclodehydratase domain-containing protein